jgi:hypothetical protein
VLGLLPRCYVDDRLGELVVSLLVRLLWRDRKADEHFKGSVENLKDMIAGQATVLALAPINGGYFDAAISGAALGTDDIGFPHGRNLRR